MDAAAAQRSLEADAVRLAVNEHRLSEELYDLEEENEGLVETIAGLEDRLEVLQRERVRKGCFDPSKLGCHLKTMCRTCIGDLISLYSFCNVARSILTDVTDTGRGRGP